MKCNFSKNNITNKFLVFCDLDGTLLNNQSKISFFSTKVIKNLTQKNIDFYLTTARPPRSSIKFYKQLNLKTWLINFNGSHFFNPHEKNKEFDFYIDRKIIQNIITNKNILKLAENIIFETKKGSFVLKKQSKQKVQRLWELCKKSEIYLSKKIHFVSNDLSALDFVYTILIPIEDSGKIKKLSKILNVKNKKIIINKWDFEIGTIFEIDSSIHTKFFAIKKISQMVGVPLKNCFYFGDNDNDIEPLKHLKNSFAMKNASEHIKSKAHHITKWTNNNDGVAKTLNEFFNLKIK